MNEVERLAEEGRLTCLSCGKMIILKSSLVYDGNYYFHRSCYEEGTIKAVE